jgi:sugar lactone lactonase YvrE
MARRPVLVAGVVAAVAVGLLGWALWGPGALEPVAWSPVLPDHDWQPTGSLADGWKAAVPGHGPEDVERWGGGLVTGLEDGRLVFLKDGEVTTLVDTGGRVLGIARGADQSLLLADAKRGLLRWSEDAGVELLADRCGAEPLHLTDDVDLAPDGTVWFTDASLRHGLGQWKRDLVEARPTGRLCRWRPELGRQADEVVAGLGFANGVAVGPDGRTVMVVETAKLRVRRLRLDEEGGIAEDRVVLDGLPGFPDGISRGTGGRYWLAIASPRVAALDALAGWPGMRTLIDRLPAALQPAPQRTARVLGITEDGVVEHDLYDPQGRLSHVITSVQERDGELLLGSLAAELVAGRPVP